MHRTIFIENAVITILEVGDKLGGYNIFFAFAPMAASATRLLSY